MSFYAFRPQPQPAPVHLDVENGGKPASIRSGKSRKSARGDHIEPVEDYKVEYKTKFNKFHGENGVRTVTAKIGPVEGGEKALFNCCPSS